MSYQSYPNWLGTLGPDLRTTLLAALAWAVALAFGAVGLWLYLVPMIVLCLIYTLLMFQFLTGPVAVRALLSILAPTPGLLIQWQLLKKSSLGGAELEMALVGSTAQLLLLFALFGCIPASFSWLMKRVGEK